MKNKPNDKCVKCIYLDYCTSKGLLENTSLKVKEEGCPVNPCNTKDKRCENRCILWMY